MPRSVRVLVIDASIVGRHLVGRALGAEPWIEVVGVTTPGPAALKRLEHLVPDVVMLDIGQPVDDGLALLRSIHRVRPRLPVIMLATADRLSGASLVEVLAIGGADLCTVPAATGDLDAGVELLRAELVPKLRTLMEAAELGPRRRVAPLPALAPVATPDEVAPTFTSTGSSPSAPVVIAAVVPTAPSSGAVNRWPAGVGRRARVELLVVGASTGGPNALKVLWSMLPRDLPVPVLVVQHMPPTFTPMLAGQLNAVGSMPCREAVTGDRPAAGVGLLAPGDHHLVVVGGIDGPHVMLDDLPRVHGCRPAVDRLFSSAAETFGAGVLAVVLTGMGVDGLAGCRAVAAAGGGVVVQDALTSVVWGMPGSVAGAGLADAVLPLAHIAPAIVDRIAEGRPSFAGARDALRERIARSVPSGVTT